MKDKVDYKPVFTLSMANRTLQLTREGGGFVFLVFGIGIGAINTGNNLLYLILAMCCSFIAVSGVLSELSLRDLDVEGSLPKNLYAGEPYSATFELVNHKNFTPSFSVQLQLLPDKEDRIRPESKAYAFHIPAKDSVTRSVRFVPLKRGHFTLSKCQLITSFPFGFFVKSKTVLMDLHTLVFPAIQNVTLPEPNETSEEGSATIRDFGDDLYSLREFQPGDSMGSVHWKSSAKTGVLRVKEFAGGGHQSFTIVLNLTDGRTGDLIDSLNLEERIMESASLAFHLIRRGDEVRLKSHDYESPFGNTQMHLESILTYLATAGLPEHMKVPA